MAKKFRGLDTTAGVFTVIGGLNWGLDVLSLNLVEALRNATSLTWLPTLVYSIVGISAVWVGVRSLMGKFMKR